MAAIPVPPNGAGNRVGNVSKGVSLICLATAAAEVGYLVARVVGDVQRIEAARRTVSGRWPSPASEVDAIGRDERAQVVGLESTLGQ